MKISPFLIPMAKLYFQYSTMNAGKSTLLLQASHNYQERGMDTYLITAGFDKRAGEGKIGSRIGIASDSDTFESKENMFQKIEKGLALVSLLMKLNFYLRNKYGN